MDRNHPRHHGYNDGRHGYNKAHLQDCPVCIHGFTTELYLRRHLLEHVLNCHRESEVQQGPSGLHIDISNIQLPYGETLRQSTLRTKRVPHKRIARESGRRRRGTTQRLQYESPPRDDGDWEPDAGYDDYKPASSELPAKPHMFSATIAKGKKLSETPAKQYQCAVCKAVFSDIAACTTHIQTHVVKSSAPPSAFTTAPAADTVTGGLLTKQFRCSVCKEAFSDSQACRTHVQTHLVRSAAGITTVSSSGLSTVPATGLGIGDVPFILSTVRSTAGVRTAPAAGLVNTGLPFICGVCEKVFSDSQACQTHVQTHIQKSTKPDATTAVPSGRVTGGLPTKQFRCGVCSDVFTDREVCRTHIKTHLQKSAGPGVSTAPPSGLVTGGLPTKQFSCGVCKAVFSNKHVCRTPIQTYIQESTEPGATGAPVSALDTDGLPTKQFRCSVCAMSFHDRVSCVQHVATHARQETKQQTCVGSTQNPTVHTTQHAPVQNSQQSTQHIPVQNSQNTTPHTAMQSTLHTADQTPLVMTCEEQPTPVKQIKPSELATSTNSHPGPPESTQVHSVKSSTAHSQPGPQQHTQTHSVRSTTKHPPPGHTQNTQDDPKLTSVESQELYRCSVCKKIFDDKIWCEKHMVSHSLRRPAQSQVKSSLLRDILTQTSDQITIVTQKLYRCGSCKEIFKDMASCERHTATHHLKPVTCVLCDRGCSSKADLMLHMDTVHPQVKFVKQEGELGQWGGGIAGEARLQGDVEILDAAHYAAVDKIRTVGQSQDTQTSTMPARGKTRLSADANTRDVHIKSEYDDEISPGGAGDISDMDMDDEEKESGEEFDDPEIITNVDVTKKPATVRRLPVGYSQVEGECHECDICGKCLKTKEGLARHIEAHDTCTECGQRFKNKDMLRNHQRAVHTCTCKLCGTTFNTPGHLALHMRRSHKGTEWPPKCEVCGKVFTTERNLAKHMVTHTKDYPYVCEVCGAGFIGMSILNRHMQTHQQEKKHKCEVCEKGFTDKDKLKTHMRIHTDERPYICERCGKGFRDKSTLNGHLKRPSCTHRKNWRGGRRAKYSDPPLAGVSPQQVFPCEICLDAFTTRSALTKHLKTCTPSEPEQD